MLYSGHSGTLLKEAIDKFKKVQFLKKQGNFRKLTELLNDIITIETETKK